MKAEEKYIIRRGSGGRPNTRNAFGLGLERSLSAYANAAVAAGVGVLAMAKSAEAKIVYTPAHTRIPVNEVLPLDLNHDGIPDFSFSVYFGSGGAAGDDALIVQGNQTQSNAVWGRGGSRDFYSRYASALRSGFKLGSNRTFFQQAGKPLTLMGARLFFNRSGSSVSVRTYGQWLYTRHRYLGLRFVVDGQAHYGWARFTVTLHSFHPMEAVLTGYAYETVPNKPIVAGKTKGPDVTTLEPASLGHLAQGASSISAWRVKNSGLHP